MNAREVIVICLGMLMVTAEELDSTQVSGCEVLWGKETCKLRGHSCGSKKFMHLTCFTSKAH